MDRSGSSVNLMDLLSTPGIKVFAAGKGERCSRHGVKDDVTDGKNKLLPVCVLACW